MKCRWMSATLAPVSASSSAIEPTTRISSKSSLAQMGSGVPQYRFREMFQSWAFSSQLWKRFSLTYAGTQYVWRLFATSFSLMASTLTNHAGTAL